MNKLRTDLMAIGGCLLLIIGAVLLLSYGRSHQVSAILVFGFALDAIAFTGIVGNLIVFLLAKFTSIRPLRVALWTFLIVSVLALLASTVIIGRLDSNVVIGYAASFVFWYGKAPCQKLAIGRPPGVSSSPQAYSAPSSPPRAANSHSASVGSIMPA